MTNSLVSGFETRYSELISSLPEVPAPTAGQVGFLVLAVGLGMTLPYAEKHWWPAWKEWRGARKFAKSERLRKQKRTKEAMDIREVRLQEMQVELITDGLLTLYAEGKISGQEYRKKMKEFGDKMGWGDLLNPKQKAAQTKEAIRERIANDLHNRTMVTTDKAGRREVTVSIPGPKPGEPTTSSAATSAVGKLVNKYWPAKKTVQA